MTHIVSGPVFRIRSLALALPLALACLNASATVNQDWTPTATGAFLPMLQNSPVKGLAMEAARSTDMAAGQKIHVVVALKLRNQAKLDAFLQNLQKTGSRSKGRFLTPAQFREQYSPTEKQAAAVVQHLRQAGFINITLAGNRQLVQADGTAATVRTAFRTSLRQFGHDGRQVYANSGPALVPASLGSIVGSVLGLQNVAIARTHHYRVTDNQVARETLGKTPGPVAAAHNPLEFSGLYNAANTSTAWQSNAAIITAGDLTQTQTDLQAFTAMNQLPAVNTSVIRTGPAGSDYSDTSGMVEWNLDSQTIVGAAGGAVSQLLFYTSPSLEYGAVTASYNQAVNDNVASVINVSLGSCEADAQSTGTQAADDNIFKQAIAQGQTFSVSSGDAGPYNCSVSPMSGAPGVPNASHYDVSEPASSPWVIAVGGTRLYTTAGSYAAETGWNDGLSDIGTYDNAGDYDTTQRLWATGGGFSNFESAPSWQSRLLLSSRRAVPDVAFDASAYSGARVLIGGQFETIGGTSLSAPIFTGIWARLQSANGNSLGFPAASFYKYFPANPGLTRDITAGNNGSGSYGFRAKRGWDAVTGFGSLDIARLNAFIQATPDFAN